MPFYHPSNLPQLELFPGGFSRLVAGKQLMLSFLEMAQDALVPEHSHPHEQGGLVLEGRLLLRIGREEHVLEPGEAYIIPSNTIHSGVVVQGPMRVLDLFSPPREDYLARTNTDPGR